MMLYRCAGPGFSEIPIQACPNKWSRRSVLAYHAQLHAVVERAICRNVVFWWEVVTYLRCLLYRPFFTALVNESMGLNEASGFHIKVSGDILRLTSY